MSKCERCKNAVTQIGAYTGTCYIECKFEQEIATNATSEMLKEWIKNPEKMPKKEDYCKYCKGTPLDGGITYDD